MLCAGNAQQHTTGEQDRPQSSNERIRSCCELPHDAAGEGALSNDAHTLLQYSNSSSCASSSASHHKQTTLVSLACRHTFDISLVKIT